MPIKSMTGFGAGSACAGDVQADVELSSVNRKQLEVVLRLPSSLVALEPSLQKVVHRQLSRGRVSGTIKVDAPADEVVVRVDDKRAAAVVDRLRESAQELKLTDDLSASMLLTIPGLLTVESKDAVAPKDDEGVLQCIETALNGALQKLTAMRVDEGDALAQDLAGRVLRLEEMLALIVQRAPTVLSNRREKLFEGLKSAFEGAPEDQQAWLEALASDERVMKEVALFGEKSDISEELTRLASHINQFRARLGSEEPVGRELDFLVQEFLREINTIGSKANDLEITKQVVAFKTELERIREQVQNVE